MGAGFDPRVTPKIWNKGGLFDRIDKREQEESKEKRIAALRGVPEHELWLLKNGFMDTHPVNESRVKAVEEELERWAELGC